MKHRSAFHTLFRKNSPSEVEMSHFPLFLPLLSASVGLLFFCSSFTVRWKLQPEYIFLLVLFRIWFWFQFPQEETELEPCRQTWESDCIWVRSDDVTQHVKGTKQFSQQQKSAKRKWIRTVKFAHYGDVQIDAVAEHFNNSCSVSSRCSCTDSTIKDSRKSSFYLLLYPQQIVCYLGGVENEMKI